MKIERVNIKYLLYQGLHDAIIKSLFIDYMHKSIVLKISNQQEEIEIELKGIKMLKIEKEDDLKNMETILDFEIDAENLSIKIFTTSNTTYLIKYGEINITKFIKN